MTYEEIVGKSVITFKNADASAIDGHVSIQFNVTGDAEGAFYLEVTDGKIDIQPYEYYDRDAMFTCSAETLLKIADGTMDPIMAFTLQKLKVEGNFDKALRLKEIIDSRK